MSVATFAAFLSKIRSPTQRVPFLKTTTCPAGTHWSSLWPDSGAPQAGTVPSTAVICDNALTGCWGQVDTGGAEQRAVLRRYESGATGGTNTGFLMLVDRLSHMGGLSGTTTGAQTVNTAALTRYTSGVDVWAAIEIYTAIGATAQTITAAFTNSAGSGSTTLAVQCGGAAFQNARKVIPMSVAIGDLGVKSVQSVTLSASTGTAGNFGVTLFKTLAIMPWYAALPFPHRGDGIELGIPIPVISQGACLQLLVFATGALGTNIGAELETFQD